MAINSLSYPGVVAPQSIDWSPLARLGEQWREQQAKQAQQEALNAYAGGDNSALLRSGNLNLAQLWAQDQQRKQAAERDARDFAFRQQEAARAQKNSDRSHWLQVRAANRADEDSFSPVKRENPDGTTSYGAFNPSTGEVKWSDSGAAPQAANVSPINLPQNKKFKDTLDKADAERVSGYADAGKLAQEGSATLDQIDALRKQAFTAPVIGPIAAKIGHPATQALEGQTNALALDVAQKMKGSLSDKDIAFVKSQVPTAATGGQAGDSAVGAIRAGFARTQQRAEFFRTWAETHGNINGADAAWNRFVSENPMTIEDKKALGGRRYNPDHNNDFTKYLVRPGMVQDGYRFKGGDPGDQNNWIKVN